MIKHEPLDTLFLTELRLAIMSLVMQLEETDFVHIRAVTGATAGNVSVQLDKLSEAGYISIEKGTSGNRPRTICRITPLGEEAFIRHFEALKTYLPPSLSSAKDQEDEA